MELTFDYQDIKRVLEEMDIAIDNVYFGASAVSSEIISMYMYWISPASSFNDDVIPYDLGLSLCLQIKGKWFSIDDLGNNDLEGEEKLDWIKTQTHINCRYLIDRSGMGTIGAHNSSR